MTTQQTITLTGRLHATETQRIKKAAERLNRFYSSRFGADPVLWPLDGKLTSWGFRVDETKATSPFDDVGKAVAYIRQNGGRAFPFQVGEVGEVGEVATDG